MMRVLELRLLRPMEIAWESEAPMPTITLRRPDKVMFDPVLRRVFVDTGRGPKSIDLSQVDSMAVEGEWSGPTPPALPFKASPAPAKPTNPPVNGQGPVNGGKARR